jgi:predicted MarR family transcription regulator
MFVRDTLDEYGLDPYEFRLYGHITRRTGGKPEGVCFASVSKMAAVCHMSVRRVQYALRFLCEAGLIIREDRSGRTNAYKITSRENWAESTQLEEIRKQVKTSKGAEQELD